MAVGGAGGVAVAGTGVVVAGTGVSAGGSGVGNGGGVGVPMLAATLAEVGVDGASSAAPAIIRQKTPTMNKPEMRVL